MWEFKEELFVFARGVLLLQLHTILTVWKTKLLENVYLPTHDAICLSK